MFLSSDSFLFGKSAFRGTRLLVSRNSFLFGNRILFQNRSYEKFSQTRKFTSDRPKIPKRIPSGSITKSYMNSSIRIDFFRDLGEWLIRAISRDQKFSPHRKYIKLIYFKEENEWKSNISQDPPFLFVSVSWFSVGFLWVPPLQGFRGFPQVSFVSLWFPWPSRNSFLFEKSWKRMVFRLCKHFPWGKINKIGTKISNRKKRKIL